MIPDPADVAELVRLPAVLSVPGDALVGAAASGQGRDVVRSTGLIAASSCFYLAGMALNDYADRDVDAVERPNRPIPSGRVSPGFALALAGALTAGGTLFAVAADGRRALAVAGPLAAAVWAYDLVLKRTPVASASMAACRGLDVVLGAGPQGAAAALPAAAVVATHTAVVTEVSQREVQGGDPSVPRRALAATAGVAAASALLGRRSLVALGLAGAYAAVVGRAHADAIKDPSPARMQRAVGVGILGLMPLEASLLAGRRALISAAGVASLWPLARKLARKRAVT
jgi:4-hydroxybenzoate polyprenyltransferase